MTAGRAHYKLLETITDYHKYFVETNLMLPLISVLRLFYNLNLFLAYVIILLSGRFSNDLAGKHWSVIQGSFD